MKTNSHIYSNRWNCFFPSNSPSVIIIVLFRWDREKEEIIDYIWSLRRTYCYRCNAEHSELTIELNLYFSFNCSIPFKHFFADFRKHFKWFPNEVLLVRTSYTSLDHKCFLNLFKQTKKNRMGVLKFRWANSMRCDDFIKIGREYSRSGYFCVRLEKGKNTYANTNIIYSSHWSFVKCFAGLSSFSNTRRLEKLNMFIGQSLFQINSISNTSENHRTISRKIVFEIEWCTIKIVVNVFRIVKFVVAIVIVNADCLYLIWLAVVII